MVRLKADDVDDIFTAEVISIPHGTIKSMSISLQLSSVCRFQFHMVRLKASRPLVVR